jgi:hypothetical protein
MSARIYKPARTAMQSGKAQTRHWRLDFDPAEARFIEPLMGWTGSTDTRSQLRLQFDSLEAARAFADKHGIAYEIEEPRPHRIHRQAYADNFGYHRLK